MGHNDAQQLSAAAQTSSCAFTLTRWTFPLIISRRFSYYTFLFFVSLNLIERKTKKIKISLLLFAAPTSFFPSFDKDFERKSIFWFLRSVIRRIDEKRGGWKTFYGDASDSSPLPLHPPIHHFLFLWLTDFPDVNLLMSEVAVRGAV